MQIGTADAYRALIGLNAVTFLGAWLVSARLPTTSRCLRPTTGRAGAALADRAFVGYAAHNALMSMQYMILLLPLPLWIVTTPAPPAGASARCCCSTRSS